MTSVTGPRRLVLLRHAKAEHPDVPDIQRPLSLVGRKQSTRVGTALAADDVVPDLVLCSSSVRTRQTWDLVRSTLGAEPDVRYLDDLYYAGSSALVELVRTVAADVRTVLVVGHEPTMSQAAVLMAGADSDPATLERVRVGVPTASWSLLEVDAWDTLAAGTASLRRLAVPQ
ncbi:histidine phosphatase family protein [Cellulomonas sp. Leaf334]|uniref:SixA phosphatase family protein n=1 Tax=Cellulomonas sp. Leaf334 TaxID=1736339 RepID=UPI0006F8B02A|nr:histidine phosphatase family protein [Cellulomonas sp. Leaf334]KQR07400.1 phosphohistidine phosphatase [Cellulomonas sp. Leaf334]